MNKSEKYYTFALFDNIENNFICDITGTLLNSKNQVKNILFFKYGLTIDIKILKQKDNYFFQIVNTKNQTSTPLAIVKQ